MTDDGPDRDALADIDPPDAFTGPQRYWEATEAWFGLTLTPEQREIHETVAENKYTLLEGANSFGKTFAIVTLGLAFRLRHYPSSVVVTSGTYGKLKRTFCADAEALHDDSGLFGEWKWSPNPHIDVGGEPTWQFEVHSPDDPEELEGVHNDWTLVIVDEADKDGVTAKQIDAMESLISDDRDRMVVACNPPRDETNVVYDLRSAYDAHLTYSTFDSHNVKVETGARDGDMVGGLATVDKLRRDWEKYNGSDWPGLDTARTAHEAEEHGLDERWLRRRAGVMPDADSSKHRPFYAADVRDRLEVDAPERATLGEPDAFGVDVARKGGDQTVVWTLYPGTVAWEAWSHEDHPENERRIRAVFDAHDRPASIPMAVDATGEGSHVADNLRDDYGATRFKASENAVDGEEWDNKWTEALYHLGQRLPALALGGVADRRLRQELFTAARGVEYELRELKSGDVLRASPKDDIKAELGRSPDRLDAFAQACWAAGVDPVEPRKRTVRRSAADKQGRRRITH